MYAFSFTGTLHGCYNPSMGVAYRSFGLTCFAVGYALGKDINNTQK